MRHTTAALLSLSVACCQSENVTNGMLSQTPRTGRESSSPTRESPTYAITADGKTVVIIRGGVEKRCRLSEAATMARLSFDGGALIVSESSYLGVETLHACQGKKIDPVHIPEAAGVLGDVNIERNLYVAMTLVSTQPWSYVATVARLGSTANLVDLPGAYSYAKPEEVLAEESFAYSAIQGPFAKISPDGRYVAPDGDISCDADAYVGVWDITNKERVIVDQTQTTAEHECDALFGKKSD